MVPYGVAWEGWAAKRHKETSRGDGNVLHLDCGGSFTGIWKGQNTPKCTLLVWCVVHTSPLNKNFLKIKTLLIT